MTSAYFLKELAANPLVLKDGKKLQYNHVVNGDGLVETTDENLKAMLRSALGRFGLREISQEEYELKKNEQEMKKAAIRSGAPRLAEINNRNPFASKVPSLPAGTVISPMDQLKLATSAKEQASVRPAEVSKPAADVKAPAALPFQPKRGRVKAKTE